FIYLGGMHPVRMRLMACWEVNSPRQFTNPTITTAKHEAADAPQRMAQGDAGGECIRHLPDWLALEAQVDEPGDDGTNQPAIEDQPSVAQVENVPERLTGKLAVPVTDDVEGASTHNHAAHQPGSQIGDDDR